MVLLSGEDALPIFVQQWAQGRKSRPTIFTDDYVLYAPRKNLATTLGFKVWFSAPEFEGPAYRAFQKKYEAAYRKPPEAPGAAVTYDATSLLLECMKAVGPEGPEAVEDCLRSAPPRVGASGEISLAGGRYARRKQIKLGEL